MGTTDLVKVATIGELSHGQMKVVHLDHESILLVNISEQYYAIGEECPHAGAPLSEGFLEDTCIECPFHGSSFDVTTGKVLSPPANESLPTYQVKIINDDILIGPW